MLTQPSMRSATGPVLIVLGLVAAIVLALLLLQTIALRSDLESARAQLGGLQTEMDALERGVPMSELSLELAQLENDVREWVAAFGGGGGGGDVSATDGDPSSPAGGLSADDAIAERLDEVLARIDALDARIDEICENVPVC